MTLDNTNPTLRRLLLELADYLAGVRESSCFELGKHQLVIYDNIKDAIAPRHQLHFRTEGLA